MNVGLAASEIWAAARRDIAMLAAYLENPHLLLRGRALVMITGGPAADFNLAMLDAAPGDEEVLREFISRVRAAGVQALFMLSGASSARLSPVAREEGLSEAGSAPLMVLTGTRAQTGRTNGFHIDQVADPARLASVADLVSTAFGLDRTWVGRTFVASSMLNAPGMTYFLATKDGEPYSTATTTTGKGLVGIWSMATAPDRQRQGAGRAVLHVAIEHHRAQGAGAFYLIATAAGKPLYEAVGFQTVDEIAIWIDGQSTQFAAH